MMEDRWDCLLFTHTTGLIVLRVTVSSLQRLALAPWLRVSHERVVIATLSFVAAFQLGAYAFRPPFDYLFGWPALGVAAWIGRDMLRGRRLLLTIASLSSFWLGLLVFVIGVDPLLESGVWQLDPASVLDHTLMWVVGGGATATIGGYVSGLPLAHLLLPPADEPVADGYGEVL